LKAAKPLNIPLLLGKKEQTTKGHAKGKQVTDHFKQHGMCQKLAHSSQGQKSQENKKDDIIGKRAC